MVPMGLQNLSLIGRFLYCVLNLESPLREVLLYNYSEGCTSLKKGTNIELPHNHRLQTAVLQNNIQKQLVINN